VLSRIDEQPDASPLHSVVSGFRADSSPQADGAVTGELAALATSNPVPES
jgi:hypothetical protein